MHDTTPVNKKVQGQIKSSDASFKQVTLYKDKKGVDQ